MLEIGMYRLNIESIQKTDPYLMDNMLEMRV